MIFALWADRIIQKASIGTSTFHLEHGKEAILPPKLALPSLALVQFIEEKPSSTLQLRMSQILKFEEERNKAKQVHAHHQQLVKASFHINSVKDKTFEIGDLVLK